MSDDTGDRRQPGDSRRRFIKNSTLWVAGGTVAGKLNIAQAAHGFGGDEIKIALIGCGKRGTAVATQILKSDQRTRLVAVADAFDDRIQACLRGLSRYGSQVDVPHERRFAGLTGFQSALETNADLVILTAPPGFRPLHFEAAIAAGKHVFMEKPVAVDVPGVHRVLATASRARQQSLAVGVGLQRRHEPKYQQTIARLQDGAIGPIPLMRAYWNGAGIRPRTRQDNETELAYQLRNWQFFTWLSGDHITEQHVHNLDVVNWLKNGYPVSANGMGGREVRRGPEAGQVFDHHFVEFTYADGSKLFSQSRQMADCWNNVTEHAHGLEGTADISGARIKNRAGETIWKFGKNHTNGLQQELLDLLAGIRTGEYPQEAEYGAMSTMTAILGRMATYSGQTLTMDDALALPQVESHVDQLVCFEDPPPVVPDQRGHYPVSVPGHEGQASRV